MGLVKFFSNSYQWLHKQAFTVTLNHKTRISKTPFYKEHKEARLFYKYLYSL